ncbi:hypothetical protein [Pelagicoccus enzymogenes]|nr:hypothetical protein [Pelagicoccus enzymogenes]
MTLGRDVDPSIRLDARAALSAEGEEEGGTEGIAIQSQELSDKP